MVNFLRFSGGIFALVNERAALEEVGEVGLSELRLFPWEFSGEEKEFVSCVDGRDAVFCSSSASHLALLRCYLSSSSSSSSLRPTESK